MDASTVFMFVAGLAMMVLSLTGGFLFVVMGIGVIRGWRKSNGVRREEIRTVRIITKDGTRTVLDMGNDVQDRSFQPMSRSNRSASDRSRASVDSGSYSSSDGVS